MIFKLLANATMQRCINKIIALFGGLAFGQSQSLLLYLAYDIVFQFSEVVLVFFSTKSVETDAFEKNFSKINRTVNKRVDGSLMLWHLHIALQQQTTNKCVNFWIIFLYMSIFQFGYICVMVECLQFNFKTLVFMYLWLVDLATKTIPQRNY